MTEEIINTDGSRNWQANILLDNVKRLEQENKIYRNSIVANHDRAIGKRLEEVLDENDKLKSALEEIRGLASPHCTQCSQIINIINEVLSEDTES